MDMDLTKQPALVIAGPTASGKSDLSIKLAQLLNGAIICCDSMQIYQNMDIGTAKPSLIEQSIVPHYLFDISNFNHPYNVSDYVKLARKTASDLWENLRVPIFCGGTGQYISALAEGLEFIDVPSDPKLRSKLEQEYESKGGQAILDIIMTFDPLTAKRLAPNDRKRIVRALEIWHQTGLSVSEINRRSKLKGPERTYVVIACTLPRDILYQRINQRVWQMIKDGLENEVRTLYMQNPKPQSAFYTAIGYKEWVPYLEGKAGLEETVDKIQQNSRNYAKRQLSLLRSKPYVYWLKAENTETRIVEIKNAFPKLFSV